MPEVELDGRHSGTDTATEIRCFKTEQESSHVEVQGKTTVSREGRCSEHEQPHASWYTQKRAVREVPIG